MIDVRDIGQVAVQALTEDGHAGKVYVLTGPEDVTYFDVARLLSNVVGKTVGHLEKSLSPTPHESDSVTARGNGRMERASHGAKRFFRS
jgi:uncharacterized protein YbjT (DUF2867 family)